MKTVTEVKTKPDARAEAVTTNLTINWEGMTEDDVRALAQQALVVKIQGGWRKNGIPAGDHEVNAADFRAGVRAPRSAPDIAALIGKLSPEEKAALLAKLTA